MAIDAIEASKAFANGGEGTRKTGDALGKDEFLKLMIAQMQNQDPLDPQSDTEFIAQLAQFSTLEQMYNMNNTLALNSATSLIGAQVQWVDSSTGYVMSGIVTSARMNNGTAQVLIGDTAVDVSKVSVVQANSASNYLSYVSLVGTTVEWVDESGKVQTGVVDMIGVNGDSVEVYIGGKKINVNRIVSVTSPNNTISEEMYQALLLIGSTISWKDENGNIQSGTVNSIQAIDGIPWLRVGGDNKLISMEQIVSVEDNNGN